MIEGHFHGIVGAEAVRSSGHHSNFVVETLDGAAGDLPFGPEPIQQQFLVSAQHAGDFLHRLQTAAQGPLSTSSRERPRPRVTDL